MPKLSSRRGIASASALVAAGTLLGSVLGQVRESVIAATFRVSVESGAFALSARLPLLLYDLMAGSLVAAALIPTLTEVADDEEEFATVGGTVLTLSCFVLGALTLAGWLAAAPLGRLLTLGASGAEITEVVTSLLRWMLPAALCMVLAGQLGGLLQVHHHFWFPALGNTLLHVGVILGALLLTGRFGVSGLAMGLLAGAGMQIVLQLPLLRDVRVKPALRLRHPQVRRVYARYLPALAGSATYLVAAVIDSALAAGLSGGAAAAQMRYATTIVQFPIGLLPGALSLAALPTLARLAGDVARADDFRRVLRQALKVMLFTAAPIFAMCVALAQPIASVLFLWGRATAGDVQAIATALVAYAPVLLFVSVDQPLQTAFYAQRRPWLPNLANVAAVAAYVVVALATVRTLGVYGLILGNVAQWAVHLAVLLWAANGRFCPLVGHGLGEALWKSAVSAGAAGLVCYALAQWLFGVTGATASSAVAGKLVSVVALGALLAAGGAIYLALSTLLRSEPLMLLARRVTRRR